MKLPIELVSFVINELSLEIQFEFFFKYTPDDIMREVQNYDLRLCYLPFNEQLWIFSVFASTRNYEIYQWLKRKNIPGISYRVGDGASRNGHFCIVQDLHKNQMESCFTTDAMDLAAAYGYLEIVRFLHDNREEGCNVKAMDWAALHGHLNIVKFLHENRKEGCTFEAMNGAAEEGRFDVVKFLNENRHEGCTTAAIDQAAINGYLDIVKYLNENRTEGCTQRALDNAVRNNHSSVVKYLLEKLDFPFDVDGALKLTENQEIFEYLKSKQ